VFCVSSYDIPAQTQRGGGGVVLTRSQPGTRRRTVANNRLRPLYSEKDPVSAVQGFVWPAGPVWTAGNSSPPKALHPRIVQNLPTALSGPHSVLVHT
jgi:hypothetical protein